jgi:prepilin-type N-terminal cleavage/methylation domain-containing protein
MYLAKTKKGFTLIELLVVVAIISLLSSVVLASLNSARSKGRDAKRRSDLKQFQIALELYYDKYGKYPVNAGDSYTTTGGGYGGDMTILPITPEFISKVSLDPSNLINQYGYYYARDYTVDSSTNSCPGSTGSYILATRLENSTKTAITTCWNNPNLNYFIGSNASYQ